MDSQAVFSRLRQFDAYPKTLEDFRVKTFSGAAGTSNVSLVPMSSSMTAKTNRDRCDADIILVVSNMMFGVICVIVEFR